MTKLRKSTQVRYLKKLLGSKSDLLDIDSYVDGRLSYEENKRIVLAKARRRGIIHKKKSSFKGSSIFYVDKAIRDNSKRPLRQRSQDGVKKAIKTFKGKLLKKHQYILWKRNKGRYDIDIVDGRGTYIKRTKLRKMTEKQVIKELDDIL